MVTIMPINIALFIMAVGVGYALLSITIQRKLTNPKKMRELQHRSKQLTNELNALAKSNAPREHIEAKQKELMPILSETMRRQMKPMVVILPVFLAMYYLVLPSVFAASASGYVVFSLLGSTQQLGSKGIFFWTVLVSGFICSMIILLYDKKKTAQEHGTNPPAQDPGIQQKA